MKQNNWSHRAATSSKGAGCLQDIQATLKCGKMLDFYYRGGLRKEVKTIEHVLSERWK